MFQVQPDIVFLDIKMKDGTERKFIEDYDTVIMRAHCENDDVRIGFGQVKTQLLPVFKK